MPDPVQAIRDAIAHLETATGPVQAQIDHVRREADENIARLEEQIDDQRKDLARWRAALDRAEGRAPHPPGKPGRANTLHVADDQLLSALQEADEPLSATQLRELLGLDVRAPSAQLTRLLGAAVQRGVIVRSGERRATRYAAP
jgi:DNA-binding transcriptional MerR regulator